MNHFLKENRGEVNQKIIIIAIIVVILLFMFPKIALAVKCASEKTHTGIWEIVLGNSPEYKECVANGTNETDPSNPSGESNPGSDGSGGTGGGVVPGGGGSGSTGDGSGGSDDGGNTTPPSEEYVPISYYDSAGVSLQCEDTLSYYNFTIPSNAPYGSVGTQTLTVNNKKGWDMWMKITDVKGENGISITGYNNLYQSIPNNSSNDFKVSWKWNGKRTNTSKQGSATVYFKTICDKPSDSEMYQPLPDYPKNFRVINSTDNSISLKWDASPYATKYRIYDDDSGELLYEGSNTEFTYLNLLPGTYYGFDLYAINDKGASDYTWTWGSTTGDSPLPTVPSNFKITNITDTSMTLSWNSVSNASSYNVYNNAGDKIFSTTNPSYTVTGLTPGTKYRFYLYGENKYGESEDYQYASATTLGVSPLPGNEQNFRVTGVTDTTVSLAWDSIPNVTGYHLWNYLNVNLPSTQLTHTATGFTPGTRYYICMAGVNAYGQGPGNCIETYTTGVNPYPLAPSNFKITNSTNTSLTVSWNSVSNATSYLLVMDGKSVYSGTNNSYTATGLDVDSEHKFYVYAKNAAGTSSGSYTSGYTDNQTYDGSDNINSSCQNGTMTKSFTMPTGIKPGTAGGFQIGVTNNLPASIGVKIDSIDKTGDLFDTNSPLVFDYDTSNFIVQKGSTLNIPIKWTYPSDSDSSYKDKAGSITVNLTTTCQ